MEEEVNVDDLIKIGNEKLLNIIEEKLYNRLDLHLGKEYWRLFPLIRDETEEDKTFRVIRRPDIIQSCNLREFIISMLTDYQKLDMLKRLYKFVNWEQYEFELRCKKIFDHAAIQIPAKYGWTVNELLDGFLTIHPNADTSATLLQVELRKVKDNHDLD